VAESPLYLACKVESVTPLGSHDLFIGRVVGMGVREDLLDESGRIALDRADLLAYSHGTDYELGQALGFFGFSVAKKDVYHKRMKELRGNRRK
jgi:flavin reductase (DIM6/NTAB) family NADH-FMN oxidoreductase RutF